MILKDRTILRLEILRKKGETDDDLINRILYHVWKNKKIK